MFKYIVLAGLTLLIILVTTHSSKSDDRVNLVNQIERTVQHCDCPETKTIYMTYKQRDKIAALEAELARLQALLAIAPESTIVYIENASEPKKKNSISLLGGMSRTGIKTKTSPTSFNASTTYRPEVGLMYQRSFDNIRGSFGMTIRGTYLLGIGIDF